MSKHHTVTFYELTVPNAGSASFTLPDYADKKAAGYVLAAVSACHQFGDNEHRWLTADWRGVNRSHGFVVYFVEAATPAKHEIRLSSIGNSAKQRRARLRVEWIKPELIIQIGA